MKKALAALLGAIVAILSPGLGAYEAAAQVVGVSVNAPLGTPAPAGGSIRSLSFEAPRNNPNELKPLTGTALPSATPAPKPEDAPAHVTVRTPRGIQAHPILPMTSLSAPEVPLLPRMTPVQVTAAPAPAAGAPVSLSAPAKDSAEAQAPETPNSRIVGKAFAALRRLFGPAKDAGTVSAKAAPSEDSAVQIPAEPSAQAASSLAPAAPTRGPTSFAVKVPEALSKRTQVFSDPERNKSFWRYFWGNALFTFGFEMYVVGLPYLISSFTKNLLVDHKDQRAQSAETLKALVRENRSLARIAHWVAQAFSYATIPLFTRVEGQGPRKWLVRSMLIRGAALILVPTVFFMSGLVTFWTGLGILFALIAAQSFFQGLSVTMEGRTTTQIMGDKSVTDAERTRANALLTFMGAVIAILGPAFAGQISQIGTLFGKTGVGGAVIYGIYALTTALAGLVYATINIIKGKKAPAGQAQAQQAAPEKLGFKGTLKSLWTSLRDGVKILVKNRFLRTMMVMGLVSSLFSDPLIFNVLPEFVENILKAHPGAINGILGIPVIGWLFKGLTNTPMGYFGLLVAFGSVGSVLATLLINPMKKLFNKLGFKSEESLMIPFYVLAALEIPAFWLMIHFPTFWGVLLLYAAQLLVTGFGGMIISGINQKTVGAYDRSQVSKILAAESFVSILAAIASTYFYGFVLTNIPIATALLIAAIATTAYGILRLVSPWLLFSKDQRKRG